MSPQKQRVAIAIACGWTADSWCLTPNGWVFADVVPDYLADLNACHEMEKTLRPITAARYHQLIQTRLKSCDLAIGATSSLRCEAFLRTLGLWEKEANTTKSASSTSAATEDSSATLTESFRDGITYTRSYQVFLPTPKPTLIKSIFSTPNPTQPNQ